MFLVPLNHSQVSWFPNIYFKWSEYIFLLGKHFLKSKIPIAENFMKLSNFVLFVHSFPCLWTNFIIATV